MTEYFTHHMQATKVFSMEPHFEAVGQSLTFPAIIQGAGVSGLVNADIKTDLLFWDRTFILLTPVEQRSFLDWMQAHHYGGLSFYMPTWTNDFTPTAGVSSGGNTIIVKDNGFGDFYDRVASIRVDDRGAWKYTSFGVMVVTNDLNIYYFKLGDPADTSPALTGPVEPGAYIDNMDGTLTLNLKVVTGDTSFVKAYSALQIKMISLISNVRQASPEINLEISTSSIVKIRHPLQSILFESDFEPPPSAADWGIRADDFLGNARYIALGPDDRIIAQVGATINKVRLQPDGLPPTGKMQHEEAGPTINTITLEAI